MGHPNPAYPELGLTSAPEPKNVAFGANWRPQPESSYDSPVVRLRQVPQPLCACFSCCEVGITAVPSSQVLVQTENNDSHPLSALSRARRPLEALAHGPPSSAGMIPLLSTFLGHPQGADPDLGTGVPWAQDSQPQGEIRD